MAGFVLLISFPKLKAERMERLKDDPFYLVDDRPPRAIPPDVDSIPIVRLDDLPPLSQGIVGYWLCLVGS